MNNICFNNLLKCFCSKLNNHYFNLIIAVWYYGAKWKKSIVIYYVLLSVGQILLSFSSYAFSKSIDELQKYQFGNSYSQIIFWLLMTVIIVLLFWFFQWPGRVIERNVALKINHEFRLNCYKKLISLPLKWHQDQHSGDIIAKINRSSQTIYRFAETQFEYLQNIVKFLVSIIFLLWVSLPVGIASLILSLSVIAIIILFDKKLISIYTEENNIENKISMVLLDYVSNMTSILTLKLGKLTKSNISEHMKQMWIFFKKEVILNEAKWFSSGILFSICQTIILMCYILYNLNVQQHLMLGNIVMIFHYQWELNEVFKDLSINYSEIVRMDTDLQSIKPILEHVQETAMYHSNYKINKNWNNIEIKKLKFQAITDVINNYKFVDEIKLNIKRGEKIALIGVSGSGKSTFLNLLAGLYMPSEVSLKIDDMLLNTLIPMQNICILIPQEPEIFKNSIRFNITFGLHTKLTEINRVLELSGLKKFVDALPNGLDTDIREKGLNLSGGQKQRLALARGLLVVEKKSIILMDEPTSNMDIITEKNFFTNIMSTYKETTMIVSLHKLNLLPMFNSLIMLEEGKIIVVGSINDLLNNKGIVRDLWELYKKQIL